jgi:hypothetical protein
VTGDTILVDVDEATNALVFHPVNREVQANEVSQAAQSPISIDNVNSG